MKNIKVISELYYPEQNATGFFLTGIAEGLAENGFNINVLCGQPTYNKRGVKAEKDETRNGVQITRCLATTFDSKNILGRLINFFTISFSIALSAFFRIKKADKVLVVTNPPLLPFLIRIICWVKAAKFYLLVHDVYPDVFVPLGLIKKSSVIYKCLSKLNTLLFASAYKIVVLGRDMRDLVQNKCNNLDHKKIVIIPNWAEVNEIFKISKEECPIVERHQLKDQYVVQYSGNHGRTHSLISLVKAAEILKNEEDITFLFIGSGSGKKALINYVKNKGIKNVIFEDHVEFSQLNYALNTSDLFVISFKKGMTGISVPSRLYNLMAAEKPILASVDFNSEVAQVLYEEQIGKCVDPSSPSALAEQILYFKNNPLEAKLMADRARKAAETKYSSSVIKEKYRLLFSEN
jgi:colanic acid biosynthesis glycosyl transferase WcaI